MATKKMAKTAWQATCARTLDELRRAYFAEVERFAETLRPRFESGELRGMTDEEFEAKGGYERSPLHRLEGLCGRHFGLESKDGKPAETYEAFQTAYLIRSVSTGEVATEDAQPVVGQAITAITHDVLALAKAGGWWRPRPGEMPTPYESPYRPPSPYYKSVAKALSVAEVRP